MDRQRRYRLHRQLFLHPQYPARSIAHGEAMSPEFQEGFYDAVLTYVRNRSADEFADDLEDAVSKDRIPQR